MTPNFAIIRVTGPHWPNFGLWLPLFLLWIPLVLLAPLILLIVVIACLAARVSPGRAIAAFWSLSCSLPGTDVRVSFEGKKVLVRIL